MQTKESNEIREKIQINIYFFECIKCSFLHEEKKRKEKFLVSYSIYIFIASQTNLFKRERIEALSFQQLLYGWKTIKAREDIEIAI